MGNCHITATLSKIGSVHALILWLLFWADPGYDRLLQDGLVALKTNRMETARSNLERAVKLKPDGGEAWAALAQIYVRLNFAALRA